MNQRVNHGHVDVEVVRLLKTFAAHETGKLQVGLRLVFGHVILERRSLAALEAADLTPVGKRVRTAFVQGFLINSVETYKT